jgi:uncharacterized protein (DUF2062 family)
MLFGRREPASWWEIFRISIWPRRSWARSGKYVAKRILRLTASPHAIAAGVAAGVFASFTPFLGFHFIIAFTVSYFVAGNFLAAALGTFFGNPFTFPFIWASTFATGKFILTGASHAPLANGVPHEKLGQISHTDIIAQGLGVVMSNIARLWDPVIKPMMIGAIPLGILAGIVAYILTRWLAIGFRAARKKRLASKALSLQRRAETARRGNSQAVEVEAARESAKTAGQSQDLSPQVRADGPEPQTARQAAENVTRERAEKPIYAEADEKPEAEPEPLPEPAEGSR